MAITLALVSRVEKDQTNISFRYYGRQTLLIGCVGFLRPSTARHNATGSSLTLVMSSYGFCADFKEIKKNELIFGRF